MFFRQEYLYWLAGIILLIVSFMSFSDKSNPRRLSTGLFWGMYGLVFFVGDWTIHLIQTITTANPAKVTSIVNMIVGAIVVLMALLAGLGGVKLGKYSQLTDEKRQQSAQRLGNKLFIPALVIPVVTVIGVFLFKNTMLVKWMFGEGNHATLITLFSMTIGCLLGWVIALKITRDNPLQSVQESRRLLDSIGWAFILPQILATLGLLFTKAGVGEGIAYLTKHYVAVDHKFIAVSLYAGGMAFLTMLMGNAFAAFPIVTAGIGIPVLVMQHGGNPAVMAAIGMFSGYCGTLMTPMAANYNIVPAALLDLPDRNAVIKVQIPTGILLLITNIFLMYFLMFL